MHSQAGAWERGKYNNIIDLDVIIYDRKEVA
jgi:hypothetical protein